ncbi:oxygenase MpaB family protein [Mucilaginibacter calamicampi]|uniref:Oxygenase MpaB family protein n=1 Tax=Mucilaginibacter calamicampi TaxID=1302352 RepID=A0ABW2YZT4_9SPHI
MKTFVDKSSVVRQIWGRADTTLFIFAGAAAEFALNKAVDWLYFTGKLPADPLGRLFSTITYSRVIIFADEATALQAIDKITSIHKGVQQNRGATIPDWAYRDVLFMLIDYSIRSFELLDRQLTQAEKEEIFDVFNRMGKRMQIAGLPANIEEWYIMRHASLKQNMVRSNFTYDLYKQYKKHLGAFRYQIVLQVQRILVAPHVNSLLNFKKRLWILPAMGIYKLLRQAGIDGFFRNALLPPAYKEQIKSLDVRAIKA